jgi:hypothetical protein
VVQLLFVGEEQLADIDELLFCLPSTFCGVSVEQFSPDSFRLCLLLFELSMARFVPRCCRTGIRTTVSFFGSDEIVDGEKASGTTTNRREPPEIYRCKQSAF